MSEKSPSLEDSEMLLVAIKDLKGQAQYDFLIDYFNSIRNITKNQTLADVQKELVNHYRKYAPNSNYTAGWNDALDSLDNKIKKIHSQGANSSGEYQKNAISDIPKDSIKDGETGFVNHKRCAPDTNTQKPHNDRAGRPTGKDVPIVSDESVANKVSTPEPEQVIDKISGANTQEPTQEQLTESMISDKAIEFLEDTQNLKGCYCQCHPKTGQGWVCCEKCQGKVQC